MMFLYLAVLTPAVLASLITDLYQDPAQSPYTAIYPTINPGLGSCSLDVTTSGGESTMPVFASDPGTGFAPGTDFALATLPSALFDDGATCGMCIYITSHDPNIAGISALVHRGGAPDDQILLTKPDGSSLATPTAAVDWKAADCPATESMTYWLKTLELRKVDILVIGAKLPIKAMWLEHNDPGYATWPESAWILGEFDATDGLFKFSMLDSSGVPQTTRPNFNLASPMKVQIIAVNDESIIETIDVQAGETFLASSDATSSFAGDELGGAQFSLSLNVAGSTPAPTPEPTAEPTATPSAAPTATPSAAPTPAPTSEPTAAPTPPTPAPTSEPTAAPTPPTPAPTSEPTAAPTPPTPAPTSEPTAEPTDPPTLLPTDMLSSASVETVIGLDVELTVAETTSLKLDYERLLDQTFEGSLVGGWTVSVVLQSGRRSVEYIVEAKTQTRNSTQFGLLVSTREGWFRTELQALLSGTYGFSSATVGLWLNEERSIHEDSSGLSTGQVAGIAVGAAVAVAVVAAIIGFVILRRQVGDATARKSAVYSTDGESANQEDVEAPLSPSKRSSPQQKCMHSLQDISVSHEVGALGAKQKPWFHQNGHLKTQI
jgi:hypothetical protein